MLFQKWGKKKTFANTVTIMCRVICIVMSVTSFASLQKQIKKKQKKNTHQT